MRFLSCLGWFVSIVVLLLTIMFFVGKVGHVGSMGDWSWGQVLAPIGFYFLWLLFWLIVGMIKIAVDALANHVRDPYRSFEPLRRLRAWRWRKNQEKHGLTDKES